MKLTIALFSLVNLFAATDAQTPKPCESPAQWEGHVLTADRVGTYWRTVLGRISYDETNTRVRIVEEKYLESETSYDILYLHNVGKMYRLDLKTRQCNVTGIPFPFRPFSVPSFAKFVMEAVIGATGVPGQSVNVHMFEGEYKDGTEFETTVTFPGCIPVINWIKGEDYFAINDFYDLNIGISDPTVFIPPQECMA